MRKTTAIIAAVFILAAAVFFLADSQKAQNTDKDDLLNGTIPIHPVNESEIKITVINDDLLNAPIPMHPVNESEINSFTSISTAVLNEDLYMYNPFSQERTIDWTGCMYGQVAINDLPAIITSSDGNVSIVIYPILDYPGNESFNKIVQGEIILRNGTQLVEDTYCSGIAIAFGNYSTKSITSGWIFTDDHNYGWENCDSEGHGQPYPGRYENGKFSIPILDNNGDHIGFEINYE